MICDHCEEEIIGDAICLDCLNIALLENQPKEVKKTPLELAAGDLLDLCEKSLEYFVQWDVQHKTISGIALKLQAVIAKTKAQDNLSPLPNLPGPDVHKSAE